MSEYQFGLGAGHLGAKARKIAEKHDATLVNYTEPDGRKRHWFACANFGAPWDQRRAARVLEELEHAKGLPCA